MAPVLGLFLLRRRTPAVTWAAVAVATAGTGTMGPSAGASCSPCSGPPATPCTSWGWGCGPPAGRPWGSRPGSWRPSRPREPCPALGALPGGIDLPPDGDAWLGVPCTGLLAGGLALILQTWAQSVLPATRAAIIMTGEPAFAALFAVLSGQEDPSARTLAGGALVVLAMVLVETAPGAGGR